MRIILATNNKHKIAEMKAIFGPRFDGLLFSLEEVGIDIKPEENGKDFKENAEIKSTAVHNEMKKRDILRDGDFIVADDTGLCIDYLDGAPGLYSARFLGDGATDTEKNNKVLELMKDVTDSERTAEFVTYISLIDENGEKSSFVGIIKGYISPKIEEEGGFGYDPIFAVGDTSDIAKGDIKTYSKLGQDKKNEISHRAKAITKLVEYLAKKHYI